MDAFRRIVLGIGLGSIVASLVASLWWGRDGAFYGGLPALVISAWAVLGHLVTIDDDAPGGWSNPESDEELWHASRRQLGAKVLVALAVAGLVFFPPLAYLAVS